MLLKKVKANTKVEIGNCISDNRISDRAAFLFFGNISYISDRQKYQ